MENENPQTLMVLSVCMVTVANSYPYLVFILALFNILD